MISNPLINEKDYSWIKFTRFDPDSHLTKKTDPDKNVLITFSHIYYEYKIEAEKTREKTNTFVLFSFKFSIA